MKLRLLPALLALILVLNPSVHGQAETSGDAGDPTLDLINALGCKGCHSINGKGSSRAPKLSGISERLTVEQLDARLSGHTETAENFMPDYRSLSDSERAEIRDYLYNLK